MSQQRGRLADFDFDDTVGELRRWYHVPALALLMIFMFWVRIQNWEIFVRDGQVLFSGNDAWYHYRQTSYAVENWPATMPFDPFTYFPYGTANSQFGTLFDQLVALAALIVGLGNPSEYTVQMTLLFAPAVFGALVAVPVYLAGKRFGGRFGGLVGVLILALSSGGFLARSLVGFSDHHIAEVLFMMIAVLGFVVALRAAQRELPVWELVANREWGALRNSAGWSVLAGVALALYLWVWPPGVLLVGILGIFFVVHLTVDYLRGTSPEPVAFVGAVALGVTGVLMLLPFDSFEFTPTGFTLLQPVMAFGVAGGCVFMAWLARTVDERDLPVWAYPGIVAGAIVGTAGLTALALPGLFDSLVTNAVRTIGFGGGARAGTIGEAQPLRQPAVTLFQSFGLAYVSAFVGALGLLVAYARSDEFGAEALLVVIWGLILLAATLTQQRFEYYLVLPVALFNAYLVKRILEYITPGQRVEEVETFQVLTILAVLAVLAAPMLVGSATALDAGAQNNPGNGIGGWSGGLEWMSENTPAPGAYGGDGEAMAYHGTYERTDDYDYPAGAYGVMSWWDYGHWITVQGERIPTANPFQQGATEAANFLLAPNETQADAVRERVGEDNAETRYVVVDWKMVNANSRLRGKFFAPPQFYTDSEISQSDLYQPVIRPGGPNQGARIGYYLHSQRYYESMVNRLWHFHGSAQQPRPVVFEYRERQTQGGGTVLTTPPDNQPKYRTFGGPNQSPDAAVEEARQYAEEQGSAQVGGVGPNPPEYVEALEHYRLVHNSEMSAYQVTANGRPSTGYASVFQGTVGTLADENSQVGEVQNLLLPSGSLPPWVKVFERVPGATIQGTGPANETVTAEVEMRAAGNNETFTYTQRVETGPDGGFEMTVPYSTTGYDEWGPENGYTNTSVRATGEYRLSTGIQANDDGALVQYTDTATVTEAQVIGEDDSTVDVTLEETVVLEPPEEGDSGNETADDGTQDSNTNSTDDGSTNETSGDGTNDTSGERLGGPVGVDPATAP